MREILFRGKRIDNGEWIEGAYMPHYYSTRYGKVAAIFTNDDVLCKTYRFPVDPETVGQYTGLKDKNGKRIFEGDIVEFVDMMDFEYKAKPLKGKGVMRFCDGSYVVHGNITHYRLMDFEMSVIGNIHDNGVEELNGD